jgi:hypothetical protein
VAERHVNGGARPDLVPPRCPIADPQSDTSHDSQCWGGFQSDRGRSSDRVDWPVGAEHFGHWCSRLRTLTSLLDADFRCRYMHTGEEFDRDDWVRLNADYPGFQHFSLQDCLGSGGRTSLCDGIEPGPTRAFRGGHLHHGLQRAHCWYG